MNSARLQVNCNVCWHCCNERNTRFPTLGIDRDRLLRGVRPAAATVDDFASSGMPMRNASEVAYALANRAGLEGLQLAETSMAVRLYPGTCMAFHITALTMLQAPFACEMFSFTSSGTLDWDTLPVSLN